MLFDNIPVETRQKSFFIARIKYSAALTGQPMKPRESTRFSRAVHYLHLKPNETHSARGSERTTLPSFVSEHPGTSTTRAHGTGSRTHSYTLPREPTRIHALRRLRTSTHTSRIPAWVPRITCNYGPCHPPCLVPVLCARRVISRGTPAACVAKAAREHRVCR